MCGIVGGIRKTDNITEFLTQGLERLEYRGYDSSGIAVIDNENILKRIRRIGRVSNMKSAAEAEKITGRTGIGHTRWATHGGVTEKNAHPHIAGNLIAVVHNGIIENYEEEKKRLKNLGCIFESETDTEVIAQSIYIEYKKNSNLFEAVKTACSGFRGSYAIGVIASGKPGELIAVRMGCPLLIGIGNEEAFIASDASALAGLTQNIIFLEDGDAALLKDGKLITITGKDGNTVERKIYISGVKADSFELNGFNHFMQKEIYEQPAAAKNTTDEILQKKFSADVFGETAASVFKTITGIKILACGTSFHAGLIAKYWFEEIAKIHCSTETSGEYRYRESVTKEDTLIITVSQSGETLDTMEALKHARNQGAKYSLSVCNVHESSLARESDLVFYTKAGTEVGVASTKAFTAQLAALFSLAVSIGLTRGVIESSNLKIFEDELKNLPSSLALALNLEVQIKPIAKMLSKFKNVLYLGRGVEYPLALEAALKLKEISYIHAEGYPAGELKHGPLALVDENIPICVIAPSDKLFEKVKSNMQEAVARKGRLIVFTDTKARLETAENFTVIKIDNKCSFLSPAVFAVPIQLLAYHTALECGTDVDKPRNLAKSVTVE
ncbi:glutamine--fructose-6-phosphate transaminase (isomerizing) [Treponema pedis]|uniref:glutamine--fructose-6-phosphate transaminase (isomerizing) n=1 Tax=Treponema pedis TaxID=409322 RepID=UPI001980A320|nr:glutamine--fructose-6-phosphate transaminase (isomerizing) [Treponema pedis]QSI04957.1 glutamine--fructose-6-phosphate transaminase (isomerizing) [Treponema pedis]